MSVLDELRQHEDDVIRRTIALLEKLRLQIDHTLRREDLSEFTMAKFRGLKGEIEVSIKELEERLTVSLLADQKKAFEIGIKIADEPLKTLGISIGGTGISKEVIRVSAVFSADLIQGLTNEVRAKVNGILRRTALGSMTTQDAMREIGTSIDKGAFKSIALRAETIVRTEVLRVQSIATQLRQEQQAKTVKVAGYELKKRWLATHDLRVRPAHLAAEIVYALNPIPIDEPFQVGGEDLMFPRDPDASAAATINCRCVSLSVTERIAVAKAA